MEEKVIKSKAETIINLMEGRTAGHTDGVTSLGDCILGLSLMRTAVDEVYKNILETISIMDIMVGNGQLFPGTHFDIVQDSGQGSILRLNYKLFYSDLLKFGCEKFSHLTFFTERQFQALLKGMPFCRAYNHPIYFCEAPGSSKKLFRGALLSADMLVRDGACIKNFLERGRQYGRI